MNSEYHPARTLDSIRKLGKSPGIVVNPGESVESARELLPLCDWVMLMTVNPGYAGQSFIAHTAKKAGEFASLAPSYNYRLAADGALSPAVIAELHAVGVESFVLGTSAVFKEDKKYGDRIKKLREII